MLKRPFVSMACCLAFIAGSAGFADAKPSCSGYGTTIDFLDTPKDAAEWSKKEGKLVFILHVSGHFEDPRFT